MLVIYLVRFAPLCACVLAACGGGRTHLLLATPVDGAVVAMDAPARARDTAVAVPRDAGPDSPPDVAHDPPADMLPDLPSPSDAPPQYVSPGCAPTSEICNGIDDDCDDVVDNDIAPVPCPGGGFRYCVGGRMSDCPARCAVCVPGGQRVCFISYCTYWGLQTCASDGQSWGYCVERRPVPTACAGVASDKKHSHETEQCCIDNGFCCLDEFDLNGNGDTTEMLGRCGDVLCDSPR